MSNTIAYKGFRGSIDYSSDDDCLYGKLIGIDDLVTYEAEDLPGIKAAFREAVEDNLLMPGNDQIAEQM